MSLVKDSEECSISPLEWFSVLPTQTAIEKSSDVQYTPLGAKNDDVLEFFVPASTEEYIDLNNSRLYLRCKIVRRNGNNLQADDNVAPVNDLLNSIFKNVEFYLNDRLVNPGSTAYGYISVISHLIHDSEESLNSERRLRLLYKDTAGLMDNLTPKRPNYNHQIPGVDFGPVDGGAFELLPNDHPVGNHGLYQRYRETFGSQEFELMGSLNINLFQQERYLPSGVNIKLRFHRQSHRFVLMSEVDNFKIEIVDAYLLMRRVRPSPGIQLGHHDAMLKMPAKFPVTRRECKVITLAQGLRDMQHDNLVLGQLPKRVVVAMVDSDAFAGVNHKNPYNFKHNNATYVQVLVDGEPVRTQPIQPNVEAGKFLQAYETLYRGLNNLEGEKGAVIKRTDWERGYSLFAFDLTPDMDSEDRYSLIKHGNLRLEIKFANALEQAINVLVYLEFCNTIEITSDRHVQYDYV